MKISFFGLCVAVPSRVFERGRCNHVQIRCESCSSSYLPAMLVELQKALLMPVVLPKKSRTCMQASKNTFYHSGKRETHPGNSLEGFACMLNMVIAPHVCVPLIVLQCQL